MSLLFTKLSSFLIAFLPRSKHLLILWLQSLSAQPLSCVQPFAVSWTKDCSTPGLPVHHQLPEFTQTHVHWAVMPSNHLILCHPRLLLPSIFPSIRVFSNESVLRIRWPKYWIFSFSISPSNEYSGMISFRIDWFDQLAVQGFSPIPQFKSINFSAISFLYSHFIVTFAVTVVWIKFKYTPDNKKLVYTYILLY